MRRRKPLGWPSYLAEKHLSGGRVGYYWQPPTWARKLGCPIKAEALGSDYAEAKRRCDEILNAQFHAWLRHDEIGDLLRPLPGTFLWLIATFKASPKYLKLSSGTRADYDAVLSLVAAHKLKDRRSFGELTLKSINRALPIASMRSSLRAAEATGSAPLSWRWTFAGAPGE